MRDSPRIRRLRSDFKALQQLKEESSILDFESAGNPPDAYRIRFVGRGAQRLDARSPVTLRNEHEVTIQLGASYPRMMPDLAWKSPIFHPNISASGVVCLGGYGTHWVPSLSLDQLCGMLWDMIRYQNYDVESPYNREAAIWARDQSEFRFPLDARPIRDLVAAGVRPPAAEDEAEAGVLFLDDVPEDSAKADDTVEPDEVLPAVEDSPPADDAPPENSVADLETAEDDGVTADQVASGESAHDGQATNEDNEDEDSEDIDDVDDIIDAEVVDAEVVDVTAEDEDPDIMFIE